MNRKSPTVPVIAAAALTLAFANAALAQRPPISIHPDVTVSVGAVLPDPRPAIGVAFGGGGSMVRFEVEYAGMFGAATATRPSGVSISVNAIVQSRPSSRGVQFYGTGGFGFYGETGSGEASAKNLGAGAKIALGGPVRLRLDYRIFILGNTPDAAPGFVLQKYPQRFLVGLNIAF